ncbi:phosphatidylinositol 4-phosphate 5-kinase-like protein 1 isoform X3 [Cervus elaphus]|uniref:phosphatidylinositol 4-phosphate 5-kinase-like protein 1 isoform X3 n=1 Tax=Cervus elaphus TaxID=9860 RepID=UPI001CC30C4D|nr:phosphatidylinositol 4-phosphate 5-kinase-like protein 1 isoform X3 [Cervus elaphus]
MLQPRRRDPQAIPGSPFRIGCSRDRHRSIGPSRSRGGAWLLLRGYPAAGDAARAREAAAGAMAAPSPGPSEILAPSPEAGRRAAASSSGHRGLLWRLRDKQCRLGLFEIGPGHELHQVMCLMQAGLWAATQVSMDHPPTGLPTEEDFSEVLTQVHEGFELGTLAGPAFARLRRSLGLAEEDYQAALGPGRPYLQFLSTSKSKASFFLSHDQRFFLKTLRSREVQALLTHLPRYVHHLQRHPHSLLARLLGVHSLRVARGKKKYFIVMQSVFYPAGRISERSIRGAQSAEESGAQNRRLLPDAPNALHIVDGPEHRYFLGLVDLTTVYGLRKRLEQLWKTLRYPGRTFSTVSPACYARRLCQWAEAHTE